MVHPKRLLKQRLLTKVLAWLLEPRKNAEATTEHQEKEDTGAEGRNCLLLFCSHYVESSLVQPRGLQQARLLCPSLSPVICSNSYPLGRWYYLIISSSAASFSFCLQSFSASESFLVSRLFASDGQSIGTSASASVLSMNIRDWWPLRLTSLISLQSKGLLRVFSSTTIWKHQLFSAQPSLWSTLTSVHDYWKNHSLDYKELCQQSNVSAF